MIDGAYTGELFTRYDGNPIITGDPFREAVRAVLNPANTMCDGQTLLLLRVKDRNGISRLIVARSTRRLHGLGDRHQTGAHPRSRTVRGAFGDRRSAHHEDRRRLHVVYTGFSQGGPLVCLAVTKDFVIFDRRGVLLPPENKDAALFPERFGGLWALIHRPAPVMSGVPTDMWISFSPDLRYWGDPQVLLPARGDGWWDAHKVGLGPPPLLTEGGWLICYHGVKENASGSIYRLGLALLDRDEPARVLLRGRGWVFGPDAPYECSGDMPGVVFPCGWMLESDGDTVRLYYGGADKVVGVATASLRMLIAHLEHDASDEMDKAAGPGSN